MWCGREIYNTNQTRNLLCRYAPLKFWQISLCTCVNCFESYTTRCSIVQSTWIRKQWAHIVHVQCSRVSSSWNENQFHVHIATKLTHIMHVHFVTSVSGYFRCSKFKTNRFECIQLISLSVSSFMSETEIYSNRAVHCTRSFNFLNSIIVID